MPTLHRTVHVTTLALLAVAGSIRPALADDDDKKLQSRKPAVIGQPSHLRADANHPDPWKLLSRLPAASGERDDPEVFQARNIILKSHFYLNEFPGFPGAGSANGADCWGYRSASGREYALMGLSWGNGIVEVTNPNAPVMLGTIPGGVNQLWRDIAVVGNYGYAVSDNGGVGVQVLNLSLLDSGSLTGVLVTNYTQGGHTTTHSLLQNPTSGFIYANGGNMFNGGFKPMSLANPVAPTFTAFPWTTSYVHECLVDTYTTGPYAGREIAFLFRGNSGNRISIVDVTNKNAAAITLSSITYPANYSHQGWLSADKKYLYHNDEIDGPGEGVPRMLTRIFDVSDLSNPRLISTFSNGLSAIDHNEYTTGRYLFQSNYTSGMHVWDLSNPLKPYEIAWIDTRLEDGAGTGFPDGTGYNGAWGNYPFFPSGTILISDLERGLFMVKLSVLELSLPSAAPTTVVPGQATPVSLQITERDAAAGVVNLMVSVDGGAYAPIAMDAQGAGLYTASIPAQSPLARVKYYFQAQTLDAVPRIFNWPLAASTGDVLTAYAQVGQSTLFTDNFQTDQGWTVQNSSGSVTGPWVRATPLPNGGPCAVIGDSDGSGMCFVTGNAVNIDVGGGTTRLLSPVLNLSAAPEARISYARWLCSIAGPATDALTTEISPDNGLNWITVSVINPASGGWDRQTFRVADFITPAAQTRVRFSVSNTDSSTTEAGIDGFSVVSPIGSTCYANCDDSTAAPVLNVLDFACFLNRFSAGDSWANCDSSSTEPTLNILDFACYLNRFATGCP